MPFFLIPIAAILAGGAQFSGLTDWVSGFFLTAAAIAMLTISYALTAFTVLYANIMVYIGLALGPIAMSMSIMSFSRKMFDTWVGFMLGAVMTKAVLGLMLSICMPVMATLTSGIASTGTSANMDVSSLVVMVLVMTLIITKLIGEASRIAAKLFGGMSFDGTPSFKGAVKLASTGGKLAAAATGAGAAAAIAGTAASFASKGMSGPAARAATLSAMAGGAKSGMGGLASKAMDAFKQSKDAGSTTGQGIGSAVRGLSGINTQANTSKPK